MKTPFHFAGAVFDMVQRRSKPKFTGLAVLAALVVGFAARPVRCAELKQETVRAFEHYVSKSESRMETELQSGPFLHLEGLPAAQRSEALRRLRAGQILLWNENAKVGSPISVPYGLIHDWSGAMFIPGVSLQQTLAVVLDWNNLHKMYSDVHESRLISHNGDTSTVFLQLYKKSIVTAVFNTQLKTSVERIGNNRVFIRSHSIRIAEVADAGQADAHELPMNSGHGFIWRLDGYSWFEQRDGGVYVQVESIALSRSVPFIFAWLVNPLLESIPRGTLMTGLQEMRTAVLQSQKEQLAVQHGMASPAAAH